MTVLHLGYKDFNEEGDAPISVILPNGDHITVMVPLEPPNNFPGSKFNYKHDGQETFLNFVTGYHYR